MAVRINVTAVRDCPVAELRAVMNQTLRSACAPNDCTPVAEQLQVEEHNGWASFTTSVWGVSAADLNRGLCTLAKPALQFTTSDGSRWHLTIHGGPAGQVHLTHEFGLFQGDPEEGEYDGDFEDDEPEVDPALAFLEEDRPAPSRPKTPFDRIAESFRESGTPLPDELVEELSHLTYGAAVVRCRSWQAEQTASAIAAAGIPVDEESLRSILMWENVSEEEHSSDLGNLPRLLSALGLGPQWDDMVRQMESPDSYEDSEEEEDGDADEEPPVDLIEPVLKLTNALELHPVDGGPVDLPIRKLSMIEFFPASLTIETSVPGVLSVSFPDGEPGVVDPELDVRDDVQLVSTADGFRLGMADSSELDWDSLKGLLGKPIARRLAKPADGTVVDLAFAIEGKPAVLQRYRGPVEGGKWRISETFPRLSKESLAGGIDLAKRREDESHRLTSEEEFNALAAMAKRDPNTRMLTLSQSDLKASFNFNFAGSLGKLLFRHRFGTVWNLAAFEAEAAAKMAEDLDRMRKMRRAQAEAARKRAAPHDPEVLHKGKHGLYWKSDFHKLDELEQETREKWDASMANLGLRHLGDLVAKKQRDVVLRIHISDDGLRYGILMGKRSMYLGYEFVTRFADGSTLTTTTNASVDSHPEIGVYYKLGAGLTAEALHEKHVWCIGRFHSHKGTTPIAMPQTLEGVAMQIDSAFERIAQVQAAALEAEVAEAIGEGFEYDDE